MNSQELIARLDTAAKIAKSGKPWQFNVGGPNWYDAGGRTLLWALNNASGIRAKPFELPRHIEGFRPLRDGEEWHCVDFEQRWLLGGYRPLVLGEFPKAGDEVRVGCTWMEQSKEQLTSCAKRSQDHQRTTRPMPDEPAPMDADRAAFEKTWHPSLLLRNSPDSYCDEATMIGWRQFQRGCAHARADNPEGIPKDDRVTVDGREFSSPLEAALHLLWLLQRLSYFEPHREGMPADGPRFRQGIIESRKLLKALNYSKDDPTPTGPANQPASDDECRRQFEHQYKDSDLARWNDSYSAPSVRNLWLAFSNGWAARGKESA